VNLESLDLNYLIALLGGVVYFLIGWAWYSPFLFADRWMAARGKTSADMGAGPGPMMALNLVASLVTVFVVAAVYDWAAGDGLADGLVAGLIVGVGVVAMESLKGVVYYSESWTLYLINTGYAVVGLAAAGAVYALLA
jgi:hypothetical protein